MKFDNEHLKKFFRKYKTFVDVPMLQKAPKNYMGKFKAVGELLKNVDFEKNLLIICNKDIMKEVFLTGFFVLPTLRDFDFINVGEFMSIQLGSRAYDKVDIRPEDIHYQDILDIVKDVLCVPCNNYEVHFKNNHNEQLLIQTIQRRYELVGYPTKFTWVFLKGTLDYAKIEYEDLFNFFLEKEDNPNFQIINLNSSLSKVFKSTTNKSASDGLLDI